MCDAVSRACAAHQADAVLATAFAMPFAGDVCAALQLPAWGIHFFPGLPTRDFAPAGWPQPHSWPWMPRRLCGAASKALHFAQLVAVAWAWWRGGLARCKQRQRVAMGLPATDPDELRTLLHTPSLYALSARVMPLPGDYDPASHFQTSFWLIDAPADWSPSPRLRAFFGEGSGRSSGAVGIMAEAAGPHLRPVCITFGSMREVGACAVLGLVTAVRARGRRVVLVGGTEYFTFDGTGHDATGDDAPAGVASGRAEPSAQDAAGASDTAAAARLAQRLQCDPGFLQLDSVPHEWLFPRCSVVVHHGGAGTTARCLLAGVPCVIVPIFRWADQALFAQAVVQLGVGARGSAVGARDVLEAVAMLTSGAGAGARARRAAAELARALEREPDGADAAVSVIERGLSSAAAAGVPAGAPASVPAPAPSAWLEYWYWYAFVLVAIVAVVAAIGLW
eukprot:g2145.t1